MQPSRGTRGTDWAFAAITPPLFVAAVAVVGWVFVVSMYVASSGPTAALLALVGVMAVTISVLIGFMAWYERRQVRHGLPVRAGWRTRLEEHACGSLAFVLGLLVVPVFLASALVAWVAGAEGNAVVAVYFLLLCLAALFIPMTFLHFLIRWQARVRRVTRPRRAALRR